MIIKDSKTVSGPWHPSIEHAMNVMDRIWFVVTGKRPRITGLGEEGHSVGSLHYGIPGDVRIRAIDIDADRKLVTPTQQVKIDKLARRHLGIEYDIVWERMDTDLAHCHLENDPKQVIL